MYKINGLKVLEVTLKPVLEWVNNILIGNPSQYPKWPFLVVSLETRAKQVGKFEQIHMGPSWHVWVITVELKAFGSMVRTVIINLRVYKG